MNTPAAPGVNLALLSVLLVEDTGFIRLLLTSTLRALGLRISITLKTALKLSSRSVNARAPCPMVRRRLTWWCPTF